MPKTPPAARLDAREISVVVQGPIHQLLTREVLKSVRQHLPGAELILSTWANSDTAGLHCDQLILSEDPGGAPMPHDGRFQYNVTRQITSTSAGMKAAKCPYAMKLRSDMMLGSPVFLEEFGKYPLRNPDLAIFEQRVICVGAINPARSPSIFMPGDWFSFGTTKDLLLLWDLPPAPEPEASRYFQIHPEENRLDDADLSQFAAEQYIWLQCLKKRTDITMRHKQDISEELINASELALANNFIPLMPEQVELLTPRHRLSRGAWACWYSFGEWKALYQMHCDPHFPTKVDLTAMHKRLVWHLLRMREAASGRGSGLLPPARELVSS